MLSQLSLNHMIIMLPPQQAHLPTYSLWVYKREHNTSGLNRNSIFVSSDFRVSTNFTLFMFMAKKNKYCMLGKWWGNTGNVYLFNHILSYVNLSDLTIKATKNIVQTTAHDLTNSRHPHFMLFPSGHKYRALAWKWACYVKSFVLCAMLDCAGLCLTVTCVIHNCWPSRLLLSCVSVYLEIYCVVCILYDMFRIRNYWNYYWKWQL